MTNVSHTPGPWELASQDRPLVFAGGQIVANTRAEIGLTKEQQLANARLIAAAPDLLEACKEVMSITFAKDDYGSFKEMLSLIIAKAEGN